METQTREEHIRAFEVYIGLKKDFRRLKDNLGGDFPIEGLVALARRLEALAPSINILEVNSDASWFTQIIYVSGGLNTAKVPLVNFRGIKKKLPLTSFEELFPLELPERYKEYKY